MGSYAGTKAWRERKKQEDPEAFRAYRAVEAAKWRLAHPEAAKAIKARHRENHIEEIRMTDTKRAKQYRQTFEFQAKQRVRMARFKAKRRQEQITEAGREPSQICELCGELEQTVFDHNHANGKFRGWLCNRCNRILGSVKDSADLLNLMIDYLKKDGVGYGSQSK